MNNSSLRESILLQSADYISKKQDDIAKRYIFKANKGEDETLPYALITQKQSSNVFKRKMGQQVKIGIFDSETIGISYTDLRKLNENIKSTSTHSPFDIKFSILEFYRILGKFVNIYQILSDGSLKKVNPLSKTVYNGKEVIPTICIQGMNCITIEFYDDGKARDYMIEVMTCVSDYEYISYDVYSKKYLDKENIVTFVNGIMINPSEVADLKSSVEVYTIKSRNIIYNDKLYVDEEGYFAFNGYDKLISNNLIYAYGYIDDNGSSVYNEYISDVVNYSQYSENEFKTSNYKDKYIHVLILGDEECNSKGSHENFYDKLLHICTYDKKCTRDLINHTLNNKDYYTKLMMMYPYYYREELERTIRDNLHIDIVRFINRSKIIEIDNEYYIKFTFPINSFSFILFSRGKVITPDIYEENDMDMSIYILASSILDVNDIHDYVENEPPGLSIYKHKKIGTMKYMELGKYDDDLGEDKYIHESINNIPLLYPITIVRSKSFSTEANRYPLASVPIYVKKSKYPKYSYDIETNLYKLDDNGRYIYYNNRYCMISNYEYTYDSSIKKFVKSDDIISKDDGYYKLVSNVFKIPYNKHLEKDPYNLLFLDELDADRKLLFENVWFDNDEANSNYPNDPIYMPNKKYNQIVRAHCNDFLTILCRSPYNENDGTIIDGKDSNSSDAYSLYDSYIGKSFAQIKENEPKEITNNIINIIITDDYVYYVTDLSYISHIGTQVSCKNIKYNITNEEYTIEDSMDISNALYVKYDFYNEENQLIIQKTDTRVNIDSGNVLPNYEDLIYRALSKTDDIEYDNVYIRQKEVCFFKNEDVDISDSSTLSISDCYTYDILNKTTINEKDKTISYDSIEYLNSDICENERIVFRRKGYPRQYSVNNSVVLYNANVGYSRYYTSNTDDNSFDIPEQLYYNFDQLMLFVNGYMINDFLLNKSVEVFEEIKKNSDYNVFISNMPNLILYESIEDFTLCGDTTIELSNEVSDAFLECNNHRTYRKNIDIVHCPLSLKYMLFFVNNIQMDEDHIEIISNRRFMLKNLDDYPQIEKNEDGLYKINDIRIYVYPIMMDSKFIDYYTDDDGNVQKLAHIDNNSNVKYYEYQLTDKLYDLYSPELVPWYYTRCNQVVFEGENLKEPKTYQLSDFSHIGLSQFTHEELTKFIHGKYIDDFLSNKTHDELSKLTYDELSKLYFSKEEDE